MLPVKVGFVVYGVHKDGLLDPSGDPFIDQKVIDAAKAGLTERGVTFVETPVVVATKEEAKAALLPLAADETIDAVVLFSGTWVWAAHMIAAIRSFAKSGKGIVIWTSAGSQGWRPVGGLVLDAALQEIDIPHRFVYGGLTGNDLTRVVSYLRASALKRKLEMTTLMAFGGRGMGQTCGVADPSQWMKTFGIDIDSRDAHDLLEEAKAIPQADVDAMYQEIDRIFTNSAEHNPQNDRSIRLYLALKGMKARGLFDFYTIQSFPGMGDYYTASCFAQSMMLDDGVPTSTLGDYNTCLTSILINSLSESPIYYGDLQHIDKARKEIKIIGDGAVPPSLANEAGASLATHGIPTEGSAGGMSVSLVCKPGKGVLARVSRAGGRFRLVMVRCEVKVPAPEELAARRQECGIPFWPHAFVTVEGDIEAMIANWGNEYACLGYGEQLYEELIAFCEQTGIEVVLP